MNNNSTKAVTPIQAVVGAQVFVFPLFSLVSLFGVSLSSFLFVLTALCCVKPACAALGPHWKEVRFVTYAFLANAIFFLLCYVLRHEARMSSLEKPLRMFVAISAMMLVLVARPTRRALWWGVTAGALLGLVFVAYQRLVLGMDRPGGLINAITFGDISLLMGLLSLAGAIDERAHSRRALVPAVGALAGLAGAVMTGTRGSWVALLLGGMLFLAQARRLDSRQVHASLAACVASLAGVWFVPATGVQLRVHQGISEVRTWSAGGSADSNVGTRLELWKGAGMLIAQHPLLGQDPSAMKAELGRYVEAKYLDPVVLTMPHLHNDALQALATGGIPGFAVWLGILAAPYMFFARELRMSRSMASPRYAPALAGMLVVLSYISFGLTEVIFWSVKGSIFYALLVFLLMGFCLNAKDESGK